MAHAAWVKVIFKEWQVYETEDNHSVSHSVCTDISAALERSVPINWDFSGPAQQVRLMICRLIGNY